MRQFTYPPRAEARIPSKPGAGESRKHRAKRKAGGGKPASCGLGPLI